MFIGIDEDLDISEVQQQPLVYSHPLSMASSQSSQPQPRRSSASKRSWISRQLIELGDLISPGAQPNSASV